MNNEPVAWMNEHGGISEDEHWAYPTPLYTHLVKELTDEEINQVALEVEWHCDGQINHEQFAKAILRKAQDK